MPRPIRLSLLLVALVAMVAGTRMLVAFEPGLVVHEWGTFTTVAGPNGQSVGWRPLSGPQDLPCFVTELTSQPLALIKSPVGGNWLKALPATVRMETPVLYFYSPNDITIDARVRFPRGFVTEWYPKATVPSPVFLPNLTPANGAIEWKNVKVLPHASPAFPTEAGGSHYYAARATDAAALQVGNQYEKFLFYRGVGTFDPSMSAHLTAAGTIAITNTGGTYPFIVFENQRGRIRYRIDETRGASFVVDRPATGKGMDALRAELKGLLIKEGLFAKEAAAMVDTWRDSWFEEGLRVFYLMPQADVDRILPLEISPAPARVVRAFVGRVEMITLGMLDEVERAIASNDLDTLNRYGRFLEPIAQQVSGRPSLAGQPAQVARALNAVVSSHPPRACQ